MEWSDDLPPQPDTPPWEMEWMPATQPAAGQALMEPDNEDDEDDSAAPIQPTVTQPPAVAPLPRAAVPPQELSPGPLSAQEEPAAHISSAFDAGQPPKDQASGDVELPDWDDLQFNEDEPSPPEDQPEPTFPAARLNMAPVEAREAQPPELSVPGRVPHPQPPSGAEPRTEILPAPPVINPPPRRTAADANDQAHGYLPYLISPHQPQEDDNELRMLTVVLRSTGDTTRDVLRLRRIHGIILSYPGEDRFAMQVYERGRFFLLEFPNSACGVCQELLDRLMPLVGVDNIRVEKITFQ
jgi:hypothetical protein